MIKQKQTNKQRDSEKFATPSTPHHLNLNCSIQLKLVDNIVSNDIYCNAISGKTYIIIIEPFFNSCRSGQHGMQCIIHINKICLHANDALRQLKLKALPSNDTQIVNTVDLRWCIPQLLLNEQQMQEVHLGKNSLDPDSDIQLKAT
ncbi:hypothetical protein T06_15227 [Trichinella sp. T6]|nr:hypothetical protein T06_15227 [Trichinella sp. T6]